MSKTLLALLSSKIDSLSLQDLETLRDTIDRLITTKSPTRSPDPTTTKPQATSDESPDRPLSSDGWREEYRKCGKSNCWCANSEKRHGPYWYRTVREGDRVSKQYWRRGRKKS